MGILNGFFDLVKDGGLPFLFLLIVLEGNPIVGSFIPGQVIVIFVGALISSYGIFSLKMTVLVAFLAAFIGDLFGYYLGKKYGVKGLEAFGVSKDNSLYKASYSFFNKYGMWSIFLGREFNLTRAFMPFLAGAFKMRYFTFISMALFSCFFWAVLSVSLGYYFGFIIVENFNFIMEFVLFLVVYVVFVLFVYRSMRIFYNENRGFLRRYAIHNFVFMGFLTSVFVSMIFVFKWNYVQLVNDYFAFLYFPSFYLYFNFLTSNSFLFFLYFVIVFVLVYKQEYKLFAVYLWSIAIIFLFYFIMRLFLEKWFGISPTFSIILYTLFIFYFWVVIEICYKRTKKFYYYNFVLVLFLLFMFLSNFSLSGNLFSVLFSFIIGVIGCELLWILSHYQILDKCLYECKSH